MALYDFQHMLKRLWLPYIILIVLHITFLRGTLLGSVLVCLGLLIGAVVNFGLFKRDYMGKNSLLINTLPMGGFWKVFCKLLWGVLFSVLFYSVFTAVSVLILKERIYVLNPLGLAAVILFFLNGYSAISLFKHCGGFTMFAGIIIFNVISVIIAAGVYKFFGFHSALGACALMCVVQFMASAHNIEK